MSRTVAFGIVGGYGATGRAVVSELWKSCEGKILIGGRDLAKGSALAEELGNRVSAAHRWAERLGYAQQDASLSAGVFRALRESNLRLLESVPRARWVECYGVHEVRGRQTVEEFVRLEAAHDLNHLRQIDRILGGCM